MVAVLARELARELDLVRALALVLDAAAAPVVAYFELAVA
jgi:hypothetical protein